MALFELTVRLDIPEVESLSPDELRQLIFDEYVHYNTISRLKDIMTWAGERGKFFEQHNKDAVTRLITHHESWAEVSEAATIEKFERVEDAG